MGANEWAKRLGINDAASLETFKAKFNQLEDAAKECPVPPKDGSRCALCRRKVMLDTRFKELCNGLCSAGGSTKSTRKTINAVNSATKILEIYRSLPAAGASNAPLGSHLMAFTSSLCPLNALMGRSFPSSHT